MLDVIGAIFGTALYTGLVAVLISLAPLRPGTRFAACAAAAAWLGIIVAVAAPGGLAPGALGPVPATLLPFTVLLALLLGSWFVVAKFRSALLCVPLPALVGVNAGRLGGAFFLLLWADGRLSAPFAPVAGLGDLVTGALAIPLAAMLALRFDMRRAWLGIWNVFGAFDLVVAVSLGALSMPNTPFHVFTKAPGTLAMTTVPWVLVPAMLVPIFLLIHLAIATRLRAETRAGRPALA
jgi:hypothetical protein